MSSVSGLSCPVGNKTVPQRFTSDSRTPNKFYTVTRTPRTFYEAKKICATFGAELPILDTQEEFDIIVDFESGLFTTLVRLGSLIKDGPLVLQGQVRIFGLISSM